MRTILITGASGFIGSHLVDSLTQDHRVISVVHSKGQKATSPSLQDAHIAELNEEPPHEIVASTAPDLCIHCAGTSSVPASLKNPLNDFKNNVITTANVLESLRLHAPSCQFLLLSSAAVYGNPSTQPITEEHTPSPISPYGYHKLQSEMLCRMYADLYNLPTSILRIFSCYGEGLRSRVFWDICNKIQSKSESTFFGTGMETRDFIHIDDFILATRKVIEHTQWNADIYNVASGTETSIQELVDMFVHAFEKNNHSVVFTGKAHSCMPLRWRADISKLSEFGYSEQVPLSEGVSRYVKWFQSL